MVLIMSLQVDVNRLGNLTFQRHAYASPSLNTDRSSPQNIAVSDEGESIFCSFPHFPVDFLVYFMLKTPAL